jgi:hypothetical protein
VGTYKRVPRSRVGSHVPRDEVVVECDAEQAQNVKAWLEKVMIEGMDVVLNGMDEIVTPVKVEARITRSWEEGS